MTEKEPVTPQEVVERQPVTHHPDDISFLADHYNVSKMTIRQWLYAFDQFGDLVMSQVKAGFHRFKKQDLSGTPARTNYQRNKRGR